MKKKRVLGFGAGLLFLLILSLSLPVFAATTTQKATLTITEKVVFDGKPTRVSGSFYVGIFNDAKLKSLRYIKEMEFNNLSGRSSMLTVNLDKDQDKTVTFYFAPVDKSGKIITDFKTYGYQVTMNQKSVMLSPKQKVGTIVITNTMLTKPSDKPVTPQTYKITYKLNGGKNSSKNPASYVAGKTVTFQKPTRKGYLFVGWYSNAGLTKKVTEITAKDTGAKTIYAKWKKVSVGKAVITGTASKLTGEATVVLKKLNGVKGYQIQTATNARFNKNLEKVTSKQLKVTLKSLPAGKTVYIRVRGFAKDSAGKTVYGTYSGVKKIKIKK